MSLVTSAATAESRWIGWHGAYAKGFLALPHSRNNLDKPLAKCCATNHRPMKGLAAVIPAIVAVSASVLAQGTIDFHNPNTVPLRYVDLRDGTDIIIGTPGGRYGPASMRVGLFIGPSGATSFSQMTMVGLTTNSASTLPIFIGTFNGGNPFTVAGHVQNEVVSFAFAAWSISTGALTYQEALVSTVGIVGHTIISQGYTLSGGGTPPAPTFGNPTAAQPWLINDFTIVAIPEPGTIVFGLAGATALWMLRRRI